MRGFLVRGVATAELVLEQALHRGEPITEVPGLTIEPHDDVVELGERLVLVGDLFLELEQARFVGIVGHGAVILAHGVRRARSTMIVWLPAALLGKLRTLSTL
jgi:hypothetical protein